MFRQYGLIPVWRCESVSYVFRVVLFWRTRLYWWWLMMTWQLRYSLDVINKHTYSHYTCMHMYPHAINTSYITKCMGSLPYTHVCVPTQTLTVFLSQSITRAPSDFVTNIKRIMSLLLNKNAAHYSVHCCDIMLIRFYMSTDFKNEPTTFFFSCRKEINKFVTAYTNVMKIETSFYR